MAAAAMTPLPSAQALMPANFPLEIFTLDIHLLLFACTAQFGKTNSTQLSAPKLPRRTSTFVNSSTGETVAASAMTITQSIHGKL
jgi:hypothetical protein